MIDVVYRREKNKLEVTVKGHAKSGEAGHDLVCAAASILAYTLGCNVMKLVSDKERVRRAMVDLKDGDATINCSPIHKFRSVVTLIFDSICIGFDALAQSYPENIRYEVLG